MKMLFYVGYVVYFGSTKRDVIFHNACCGVGWLRREGVEIKGNILDTVLMQVN